MPILKRIKVFSIEETESIVKDSKEWGMKSKSNKNKHNIKLEGYDVYTWSHRYRTFIEKGHVCACCGRKGTYYALEVNMGKGMNHNRAHFNLYSDDDVLMTVDHIYPKSLGGMNTIGNMQTMCQICNLNKGNSIPDKYDKRFVKLKKGELK